jgi:hypothetical protein
LLRQDGNSFTCKAPRYAQQEVQEGCSRCRDWRAIAQKFLHRPPWAPIPGLYLRWPGPLTRTQRHVRSLRAPPAGQDPYQPIDAIRSCRMTDPAPSRSASMEQPFVATGSRPGPDARRPQPQRQLRRSRLSVKRRPALRAAESRASAPAMASGRGLRDRLVERHLRPWDACSARPVLGFVRRAVPVFAEQRRALLAHPQGATRRSGVARIR